VGTNHSTIPPKGSYTESVKWGHLDALKEVHAVLNSLDEIPIGLLTTALPLSSADSPTLNAIVIK
jgi:hypothetical protein